MIGLPGDSRETVMKTFEFAKELDPDMAFFQQAVPFPGTEMYEWAREKGYLVTEDFSKWLDDAGRLDFLLDYPGLSRGDIQRFRDEFMRKYYFRPSYFIKTVLRNLSPGEMERVMRSGVNFIRFWIEEKVGKGRSREGAS